MKIYCDISLERFDAWSGGEDTLEVLREKNLCEKLEPIIEDIYPDGCTDTELNDLLWFERDSIADWLGFEDWEDLENDGEEDEEDYDGETIQCPNCGEEIIIEFNTARCEECGWMAADAELDEIMNED